MQATQQTPGATDSVAEFVSSSDRHTVRAEDRAVALASLLDTVHAAVIGAGTAVGRNVVEFARARTGAGQVVVTGVADPLTAPWAAFAYGALASASGLDDAGPYGAGGAPVWSALLALSQVEDVVDDDRLVEAFCVGLQAALAIFDAGQYAEAERGFAGVSVFGAVAAALACCRLLRLDAGGVVRALGVVSSEIGGVISNNGTDVEALHTGFAARNGLQAAVLARSGIYGAVDVLEARQGFGEAYFGLRVSTLDHTAANLTAPAALAGRLALRRYPAHPDHQGVLRTIAAWFADGRLSGELVELVEVFGVPPISGGVRFDAPQTPAQAVESLRYTVGCVSTDGDLTLGHLSEDAVAAAEHSSRLDLVQINILPRWARDLRFPHGPATTVRVTRRDGTVLEAEPPTDLALGEDAVRDKWSALSAQLPATDPRRDALARLAEVPASSGRVSHLLGRTVPR